MFRKKTVSYSVKEFMQGEHKIKQKTSGISLAPLVAAPFIPSVAHAETAVSVQGKMMTAFTPIIDMIQGLAYPVAMVVVLGGAIFVMIGNSEKGFSMMQKAGMGYLLVMVAPMILDVLVDAMKGVAQ